jgi:hypothetical protein
MSTSAKRRPTGNPSMRSVLANQALLVLESISRPSPAANRLRSSSGTKLWTGKRRGSDEASIVPFGSSRIAKRGSKIGGGQQPKIALLILGEPPKDDLRSRDGDRDHQAGHQHRDFYHQGPGGNVPQPHHQDCTPFRSSTLLLAPNPTMGARSEIQAGCRCPLADNKMASLAQPRADTPCRLLLGQPSQHFAFLPPHNRLKLASNQESFFVKMLTIVNCPSLTILFNHIDTILT